MQTYFYFQAHVTFFSSMHPIYVHVRFLLSVSAHLFHFYAATQTNETWSSRFGLVLPLRTTSSCEMSHGGWWVLHLSTAIKAVADKHCVWEWSVPRPVPCWTETSSLYLVKSAVLWADHTLSGGHSCPPPPRGEFWVEFVFVGRPLVWEDFQFSSHSCPNCPVFCKDCSFLYMYSHILMYYSYVRHSGFPFVPVLNQTVVHLDYPSSPSERNLLLLTFIVLVVWTECSTGAASTLISISSNNC